MKKQDEFNLYDFMCDSLCVNANSSPTRPMYKNTKDPYIARFQKDPFEILGEVGFKAKNVPEDSIGTPIQEFFRGANVFITGGTGFLGTIVLEKLLRDMPHIGNVYVLIRSRWELSHEERFNKLLENKVFSRMKAEVPNYHTKLKPLSGDLSEPGLGLSDEDRKLIQDTVHIFFHCAADVRFVKPLKTAVACNVLGSKRVLDLAKNTPGIKSYVHVSTAYSHAISRVIEENIPKININYKEVLDFLEANKDNDNEVDFQNIMQGFPNTYIFSKALCEDMLQEEAQGLPLCIIRPTVVMSTNKEPVRGWTNNVYGPLGLILGAIVGVLHCFQVNPYHCIDVVPVDYVSNCMIAAAFKTGSLGDHKTITVYNVSSKLQNILCWKQLLSLTTYMFPFWPTSYGFWYISFFFTENDIVDNICHILLHRIPGAILDKMLAFAGHKPRFGKIFRTIDGLRGPLKFFKTRLWEIKDDNVTDLWRSLSEKDKQIFDFDVKSIEWREYAVIAWLGLRYYFLKESMDTIPFAKMKLKGLYVLHLSLKLICGFGLLKLAVRIAHILPF